MSTIDAVTLFMILRLNYPYMFTRYVVYGAGAALPVANLYGYQIGFAPRAASRSRSLYCFRSAEGWTTRTAEPQVNRCCHFPKSTAVAAVEI
jgi:hypothetical protein